MALVARREFARAAADVIQQCGRGFSALGLAEGNRKAVSIAVQLAGEIASGAVELFGIQNWYAGAALVRQLVELEYLLFLFATDTSEATRWLSSSPADLRKVYSPAAMRRRSKGNFKDSEYWAHCDVGGHPHWKASVLLPERIEAIRFPADWMLWLDFAHHLTRVLRRLDELVEAHGLTQIVIVADARQKGAEAYERWLALDPDAIRSPHPIGRVFPRR
jgi:hypothetical protein